MVKEFDLQLFARAEDEGRTEQPTHRKLERARRRGHVAKTVELSPALVTLTTCWLLSFIGWWTFKALFDFIHFSIHNINSNLEFTQDKLQPLLWQMGASYIKVVAPLMACALTVAFITEAFQVGLYFSPYALAFDLGKVKFNFSRIWQRMVFSARVLVEYGKTIFKVAVISYFAYTTIRSHYTDLILAIGGPINLSFFLMIDLAYQIMMKTAIFLVIMSILDYLYQRYEYRQSLMMTRHELRDEWKQMEGDPLLRARIRERQRQMAQRRMMAEVPKADVVITNPIYLAIAIRYDSATMSAPTVVAKGESYIAERIVQMAKEYGVPVVENKPLAEALYKAVEIGEEIKREFYEAVAEILSFVYRLKRRAA
jgi:flagellar biosynthetic protein FlhB